MPPLPASLEMILLRSAASIAASGSDRPPAQ
jgi:hypothetical protein